MARSAIETVDAKLLKNLPIPPGFENYFLGQKEPLEIIDSVDLLPQIQKVELGRFLQRLEVHELKSGELHTRQHLVFIEDFHGYKALLAIAGIDGIGGTGVYPTLYGESPAEYAIRHALSLKEAMDYKTAMAGLTEKFGLTGIKATVAMESGQTGLSDWEKSAFLQMATGWLFSQSMFPKAITGTDARQTENTIGAMAIGSALGNSERVTDQICGTRRNFDTPGACRYSLEATLDVLAQETGVLNFEGSVVSIQGFGRIGRIAVQLALDRGVEHIFLSEIKLPVNSEGRVEPQDTELYHELLELQEKYPGRITVVNDIYSQKADIFMPCSSQEGQLNQKTLEKLHQAGVKVILAGANNILQKEDMWQLARIADSFGIVMPPEVLSNCGSVTMAGMEREYHRLRKNDPTYTQLSEEEAEIKFRDEVVIPFIRENAQNRVHELLKIAYEMGTDIYTAGEIWYLRQQGLEAKVDENGKLVTSD